MDPSTLLMVIGGLGNSRVATRAARSDRPNGMCNFGRRMDREDASECRG